MSPRSCKIYLIEFLNMVTAVDKHLAGILPEKDKLI